MNGALILVLSTVLVKVVGAIFKIPLTSLIGGTGRGYFSTAYNIYTPIYAISLAGLPTAVSKLVSQYIAQGNLAHVKAIKQVAMRLFLLTGTIGTLLLILVAYPYAKYVAGTLGVIPSILVIAPSVFFCCWMSCYRGYYEGQQNMVPTAMSQVIEVLSKLVFGLVFAYFTMQYFSAEYLSSSSVLGTLVHSKEEALSLIYPYTAATAVLGVTIGTLFGLLYLMIYSRRHPLQLPTYCEIEKMGIAKELILIAVPIVLGSLVQNISNLIDTVTIQNRLEFALSADPYHMIERMYSQSFSISGTLPADIKTYLFGVYNAALDFKNLVPTVTLALGVSALPAISRAWTLRERSTMNRIVNTVLKFSMIIGAPIGFGMAILPQEILSLVYRSSNADLPPIAAPIVCIYGIFMFLFAVSGPLISLLQGIGKASFVVKTMAIGAVIKIALNWILVGNPVYNIKGAPIATIFCFGVIVLFNLIYLLKETGVHLQFVQVFMKPMLAALCCAACAKVMYVFLIGYFNNSISLLVAVSIAACVYFILLLVTKAVDKKELALVFKSKKMS